MADKSFSETVEQMKADAMTISRLACLACVVVGVFFSAYIWRLYTRLISLASDHIHEFALIIPFGFVVAWGAPIALFLQYTRMNLPTWLTFGHPVAFGGVMPDVCDDISWAINPETGGWPCVSSCWGKWLADMYGPDDWEFPCYPGAYPTFRTFIIVYMSSHLGYIIWLLCNARKRTPKCADRDPVDLAIENLREGE